MSPQKNEHYWRQKIDDYLLDKLDEAEREQFEEYYFTHSDFFEEVRARKHLIEAVQQSGDTILDDPEFGEQPGHSTAVSRRWLVAAAVLLVGIISGGFWYLQQDTAPVSASHFVASPNFEPLVGQVWRSSVPGLDSIVAPRNYQNINGDVLFEWRGDSTIVWELSIYSNQDSLVRSIRITGTRFVLKNTPKYLPPGRYYWQLDNSASRKPPYIGCFFVRKPDDLVLP